MDATSLFQAYTLYLFCSSNITMIALGVDTISTALESQKSLKNNIIFKAGYSDQYPLPFHET